MVTALTILASISLAISGAILSYTQHKKISIWVLFVALVLYSLAFCYFLHSRLKEKELNESTSLEKNEKYIKPFRDQLHGMKLREEYYQSQIKALTEAVSALSKKGEEPDAINTINDALAK